MCLFGLLNESVRSSGCILWNAELFDYDFIDVNGELAVRVSEPVLTQCSYVTDTYPQFTSVYLLLYPHTCSVSNATLLNNHTSSHLKNYRFTVLFPCKLLLQAGAVLTSFSNVHLILKKCFPSIFNRC